MENQNPAQNNNNQTPNPQTPPAPPAQASQTPPQNPPSPNTDGKKKFSLKLIIGIIVFLLLAGGAAASYVYREPLISMISSPTPTPALIVTITPVPDSTDKTYSNNKYGFTFEYPNDWLVNENDPLIQVSKTERIEASGYILEQDYKHTITLIISPLDELLSLDELQKKVYESNTNIIGITPDSVVKTLIGGKDAVRFDISQTGGYSWHGAQLTMNNYLIWISGRSFPNSDLPKVFNQILSTFKFTDSNIIPTPTCIPKPACLDETPQCLMPEPANGWCP